MFGGKAETREGFRCGEHNCRSFVVRNDSVNCLRNAERFVRNPCRCLARTELHQKLTRLEDFMK